ncbi:hypothetical protein PGT21_003561 [Puccinia graminis f. sp. tritici]|uniref:Uncharacterized protein n=1 Tax=Puccinia graminis f. sp. tritici TaxID=56615 RepID=A0A5B0LQW4_PUCGR|nr:hypothetical protein PGT21_003561 [Puccinia graminis f. sp. tritici]KAA1137837.1 hypothetical protein PGTUg99_023834 [Puccinia graminis f. sp. tritici]
MPKNPPRGALPGAQAPRPLGEMMGKVLSAALTGAAMLAPWLPTGGPPKQPEGLFLARPGETARPKIPNRIRPARTSITKAEPEKPPHPGAPTSRRAQEDLEKARLGALSSKVEPPTLVASQERTLPILTKMA